MARARFTGIEVDGVEFVRSQLAQFTPRETKSILRRSVVRIAANLRKEMRKRAPKDDGTLRKAIISKRERGTRDTVSAAVWITHGRGARNDAWYWHMVAFGTETQAPNDFLTPVVEEARRTMSQRFENEVVTQLNKELAKRAARQRLTA